MGVASLWPSFHDMQPLPIFAINKTFHMRLESGGYRIREQSYFGS